MYFGKCRVFLALTALTLMSLEVNANYIDTTTNREWQTWAGQNVTINADTLAQLVIDTNTGELGGYYEGWYWASREDVVELFENFGIRYPVTYTTNPPPYGSFAELNSTWAAEFLNEFGVTYTGYDVDLDVNLSTVHALTRSVNGPDIVECPECLHSYYGPTVIDYSENDSALDFAGWNGGYLGTATTYTDGVWEDFGFALYRQTDQPNPAPTPAPLLLLASVLPGMWWASRRKRKS